MMSGLLLAAAATLSTATPIDFSSWFHAEDYPIEAMKAGIEGSVTFEVDVDAEGKPTACRIATSSGSPILDQTTCDIVRARARFKPALGADGKRVPGKFMKTAVWRLEDKTATTYQAAILDFGSDPAHPSCTIKTGPYPLSGPTCEQILTQASQQKAADHVVKLVFLLSVGSSEKPLYKGEPEWGRRVSYLVSEQYSRKGGLPMACLSVAAEGSASGQDACAGFIGARTVSVKDKAAMMETRTEQSIFAVLRSTRSGDTCDNDEGAGEAQGCN